MVTELGTKVDPDVDRVSIDGKIMSGGMPPKVYWLLHKPDRVLTSRAAQGDKETIYQLPRLASLSFLVNPIGRLDYRTEGLLLLSNDGEFVHRLSHPRFKLPRHYHAQISRRLSPSEEKQLRRGIELEDGPVAGVELRYAHAEKRGQKRVYWYFISVFEGRNRLVRRLFEFFDAEVTRLIRYGFGDLRMRDDLPPGEYKQLSAEEIKSLRTSVGLTRSNS